MTDLVTFLLARIGEDEEAARLVRPNEYLTTRDDYRLKVGNPTGYSHVAASSGRALAECTAKRQIVARIPYPTPHYLDELREWESCPKALTEPIGDLPWGPDAECTCGADKQNAHGGSPILRCLALPYAAHPDFDPAWRLEGSS